MPLDMTEAPSPDTGVWVQAELDDDGEFAVRVYCAAAFRKPEKDDKGVSTGELGRATCTVWDDIADSPKVPKELKDRLKQALQEFIDASRKSLTIGANRAAMRHEDFEMRREKPGTVYLDFKGSVGGSGDLSKKADRSGS